MMYRLKDEAIRKKKIQEQAQYNYRIKGYFTMKSDNDLTWKWMKAGRTES